MGRVHGELAGICRRQGSLAQSDASIWDRVAMVDQSEAGKSDGSDFCHQTSLESVVGRAAQAVAVSPRLGMARSLSMKLNTDTAC